MEFVPAGSLHRLLHKQGLLPEAACALVLHDTLEGLAYLHGQGHIHMDIKPGNILLTLDGHAKLCDLGVAKGVTPAKHPDTSGAAAAAEASTSGSM